MEIQVVCWKSIIRPDVRVCAVEAQRIAIMTVNVNSRRLSWWPIRSSSGSSGTKGSGGSASSGDPNASKNSKTSNKDKRGPVNDQFANLVGGMHDLAASAASAAAAKNTCSCTAAESATASHVQ